MTSSAHPSWLRLVIRGLTRRCPHCGGGRLFTSWLRMVDRCPRCGIVFERDEGFFLGAFVINFSVVLIALAVYIGVAVAITLPDPPLVTLSVLGGVVGVVMPIAFYPFSRTLWSAIDLVMKPLEAGELASAAKSRLPAEDRSG